MKSLPVATYRLQFRNGMTFDSAVEILPYLKRLGVSHLYASPIFTATTGSTHGYDVTDHNSFDPSLGGRGGFERLVEAMRRHGLGLVLDIVPNHMAASLENAWWRSVVEWGGASPYAQHFDVDWSRKLTLPILGRPFDEAKAAGEFRLRFDSAERCVALSYFDHFIPLDPATYTLVAERLDTQAATILRALASARADIARQGNAEPAPGEAEMLSAALGTLADPAFIDAVHAAQPWQLMYWKNARRSLSYRRFFEVTGLVGVRVEDEPVFADVHRLALSLVRDGLVDGLRVDHVDGLARPGQYLERLREAAGPDAWILVEKILAPGERLPEAWEELGVGTTGYEFISAATDLLLDAAGAAKLRESYAALAGRGQRGIDALRDAKRLVLTRNFEGELDSLVDRAIEIGSARAEKLGRPAIREAVIEIILAFPVYRTYVEHDAVSLTDRGIIADVAANAVRRGAPADAVQFIRRLLAEPPLDDDRAIAFVIRFQQLTGPIMAKAVEDTYFYRDNAVLAANEVGLSPETRPGGPRRFHAFMNDRPASGLARGLAATATHDTKRGEDARARLCALAENPASWTAAVARWRRINKPLRTPTAPEPDVEWLLYQALAGTWPTEGVPSVDDLDRLSARFLPYVEKAIREAKLATDWLDQDDAYEDAVRGFAKKLLEPTNRAFLDDFARTLEPFIRAGKVNALSQTLAKLTGSRVPDLYQSAELEDLSLVDPDNRRPVDFAALDQMLEQSSGSPPPDPMSGRFKQWLVARCLSCRADHAELFAEGTHEALPVNGAHARYFVASLREHKGSAALVLLQRLPMSLMREADPIDASVELPARLNGVPFANALTDSVLRGAGKMPVQTLLDGLPVALLVASS